MTFSSQSQIVTFHCMETGSLLRDNFEVSYLCLSGLSIKWQQFTVPGKSKGIYILIIQRIDGHLLALDIFTQCFNSKCLRVCVSITD